MLAQSWDKYKHLLSDDTIVAASPKLDGIRCVVARNKQGKILYFSRNGALFESCDHLNKRLAPLFEADPNLVLDGELYNHDAFRDDFPQLVSAVRTTRSKRTMELLKTQKQLQLHCFDVMYSGKLQPDADYRKRYNYLASILGDPLKIQSSSKIGGKKFFLHRHEEISMNRCYSHAARGPSVQLVPSRLIRCGDLVSYFNEARSDHYEGIMIKLLNEPYAHGKRSSALLKFKQMQDMEYPIAGAVKGTGKWQKSLGAFICRAPNGTLFSVAPSVNEALRMELWRQRSMLVGKALTVQFQDVTSNGVPRFPIGKAVRGHASGSDWV